MTNSVEDARYIHINFRLLAELISFEQVVEEGNLWNYCEAPYSYSIEGDLMVLFIYYFFLLFQDIQLEIENNRDVFNSLSASGKNLLNNLASQEDAVMLQRRLDEMNQRWQHLKTKSMAIRYLNSLHFFFFRR